VLMLQNFNSEKSAWADAAASSAQPEEFLASVSDLLSSKCSR